MLAQHPSPPIEQQTHRRILQAAQHLFATQGYERTTTKQLAEAAGVAEGTLFRHFENKHAIWSAVAAEGWDILLSDLLATLCEVSSEDIVSLFRHRLQDLRQHNDLVQVCLLAMTEQCGSCTLVQQQRLQQMLSVLEAFIQTGIDRGIYRPLNPNIVAHVLLTLFMGNSWLTPIATSTPLPETFHTELADTLAEIMMHGLLQSS
jgi:AcrR family transcriptional regulator